MSRKLIPIVAIAVCAAGAAMAGSKFTGNGSVTISLAADGSGSAFGHFGQIYNGPGVRQWMGCQRNGESGLFCTALNEAGLIASCAVNSAYLAKSVSSISPDTRVLFAWNAQGTCTRIQVMHSSELDDKHG